MRNGYLTSAKDSDKYLHVELAETALGRTLPAGAVVHHVDGNPLNNAPSNLVVCQDQAHHMVLHTRQRIVDAGGDPNTQKLCKYCRALLEKVLFSFERSWDGRAAGCRECTNARRRKC